MKKILLLPALLSASFLLASINIQSVPSNPKRENLSNPNVILSYNSSIKDIKKSVVNISSTKNVKANVNVKRLLKNPFFRDFFGNELPKQYSQGREARSLGSGVIISKSGYIVTNNHVIAGADKIVVTIHGNHGEKKEYTAKIIGQDPKTDLAVIKIDASSLPVAKFGDSSNTLDGDIVFAIGDPFGVGESISQGIVSAMNKNSIGLNQYENFIQTDASINPGNSGGALVDSRGALIGINSAIITSGGGNNGIGFAIPSNMVKRIAISLIKNGKIKRGYLGVSITNLKNNMKGLYKNKLGALILQVEKDSSAYKAGLKRGDLIIGINDKKISNANDLKNLIGSILPNKNIKVVFERNKEIKTTTAKLANMNNENSFVKNKINSYIKGLSIIEINDQVRSKYGMPENLYGLLVTGVKPNSEADKIGFKRGDIIIQIQSKVIKTMKNLNIILEKNKNKNKMIYIRRHGYITYLIAK